MDRLPSPTAWSGPRKWGIWLAAPDLSAVPGGTVVLRVCSGNTVFTWSVLQRFWWIYRVQVRSTLYSCRCYRIHIPSWICSISHAEGILYGYAIICDAWFSGYGEMYKYVLATLNAYCTCIVYSWQVLLFASIGRGTLRARHEWEYYVERAEIEITERITL